MMISPGKVWTAGILGALLLSGIAAEKTDFSKGRPEKKASAVFHREAGNSYTLRIDDPHWDSALRILPPDGQKFWDLTEGDILAADVKNLSPNRQLRLNMQISSGSRKTKDYQDANVGIGLNPGEERTIRLRIPHKFRNIMPKGVPGPRTLDGAKVDAVQFFMQWPFEQKEKGLLNCRISNLRLEKNSAQAGKTEEKNFFPFMDRYGQYIHADWNGKIKSDKDLKRNRIAEEAELAKTKRPAEWNRFGGWQNGPKLKATGAFRTEKYQGKWYLVDPDGRLFFSHGIDVLIPQTDSTATKKHEHWFASARPLPTHMAFSDSNLKIKFGKEHYTPDFYRLLTRRLEAWGINTIGNWGRRELMETGKTPYTLQLTDFNYRMPRYKESKIKFYDVFDPVYAESMRTLLARRAKEDEMTRKSLTDPMCIGYFIDNELNFGNRRAHELFQIVLKTPPAQAAKKELLNDLKTKYKEIGNLNKIWKTAYPSWEALLNSKTVPQGNGYREDANAFLRKAVNRYFELCREGIKNTAPHRLYLGTRFISTDAVRPVLYEASKKYSDVLSVNIYAHSCANFGNSPDFPDMPVIIGEFHFGIFTPAMFSASLCPVGTTQQERAIAYKRFLEGALVNPKIVGAHWFQYRDQPLTGRWDGEGYPIGFVDVADTPYPELTRAAREIGEKMYQIRQTGKLSKDN